MYFLTKSSFQASFDPSSVATTRAYPEALIFSSVWTICPSTSESLRNGTKVAAYWLASTKPMAIRKDCRPRRRLRCVATSTTLPMRAVLFFSFGNCTNARRIASPIGQVSRSNACHWRRPNDPATLSGDGRSASHSNGARPIASSQAATTSSSEAGTGKVTGWRIYRRTARKPYWSRNLSRISRCRRGL